MKLIKMTLIAAACAALSAPAFADDTPHVSFSGFGTASLVHNDNKNLDFVGSGRQPNGAGATDSASFGPDSILAVQMNASLSKDLSAIVQVVSKHQFDNTYNPAIEWAFVKYQATPTFDIALGRTALPAFALSDSRFVGYSYLWARPPIDVYYQVSLTSVDGIGASWHHQTPLGQLTIQGAYGVTELSFPNDGKLKGKNTSNISASLESGAFTWRAGYSTSKVSYNAPAFDSLVGGFYQYAQALAGFSQNALAAEAIGAGDALAVDGKNASFADIGVTYDKDNWIAQAEWTARKGSSIISNTQAWHASTGYRVGNFTPYLGLSSIKTTSDLTNAPQITVSSPAAATLNAASSYVISGTGINQDTTTLGLKWNFRSDMDLKLQYDNVRLVKSDPGAFINQTGSTGNTRAGIATIALDFVF